jgi:integrase
MKPSMGLKVDRKRIERVIQSIPDHRDRMFISCLFLTGARISEVVKRLRGSDTRTEGGVLFVHLITLKRRGYTKGMPREVPIMLSETLAPDFLSFVMGNEGILFPFTRITGWRIVKKHFEELFPHFFRHARSTLLMKEISTFNLDDLKVFHNWTTLKMAEVYVHGQMRDVVNKMKKG